MSIMPTLRTAEIQAEYDAYRASIDLDVYCPMCEYIPIKTFRYWKIIENKFPYNKISQVHHLLVPLRHTAGDDFMFEELREFKEIRSSIIFSSEYDMVTEVTYKGKTVKDHFHLHLIKLRDDI